MCVWGKGMYVKGLPVCMQAGGARWHKATAGRGPKAVAMSNLQARQVRGKVG